MPGRTCAAGALSVSVQSLFLAKKAIVSLGAALVS